MRPDGLRVWLDDWQILPGDSIPAKIEEGLEGSRVLVLCMSAHAFGSEWAQLEASTFRFRDPLNRERRFIPLRLDDAPIKGSLAQFLYIDWVENDRESQFLKLLEACRPPALPTATVVADSLRAEKAVGNDSGGQFLAYDFSPDGKWALSGGTDRTIQLYQMETGVFTRVFEGHTSRIRSVVVSGDRGRMISGADDHTLRVWDMESGTCLRTFDCESGINCLTWSGNGHQILSGDDRHHVRLWEAETGICIHVFKGHTDSVMGLAGSNDGRRALSCSLDGTVRLWDLEGGVCVRIFEGHTGRVFCVAWSADERLAISGSEDATVRLWDVESGRCLRVLEGHTDHVKTIQWCASRHRALSGAYDNTVRLWDLDTGDCVHVLTGHVAPIYGVVWIENGHRAISGDGKGNILDWDLSEFFVENGGPRPPRALQPVTAQVQYANAKVLLVGDTSAGKTGLSMRLATDSWQPSDSTVGAWATHWKLPVSSADGLEREIWLWDFGGQADQRLIHQLYMEDTALAVLVFDGQKEDLLETLGQWDRDLTRASSKPFTKVLAAGRVDAGGLRVSRSQIEQFRKDRGFARFLETSAKSNLGCEELKEAIVSGIDWSEIPWRSSPRLFKRLKEEIVRLRDEGRVLMRFNELRDALRLRLAGEGVQFEDRELKAVAGLLTGPEVVWELTFGNWVLLQPERINAYAQAVIQTLRLDESERGCLPEERVLGGNLAYQSSMRRLEPEEERFVLLAMHQTLVERGLCLRENTENGPLLIFPSYYRRERQNLVGNPAVLVSYQFSGFLDDIYATLVVRLHHTKPFQQDQLWRYAADFRTLTGRKLGIKLTRRAEGAGDLEVYFDRGIPVEEKIIFSRYIHEHLLQKGKNVVRLRHYICPHCGTPVGNREVAMRRLQGWLTINAPGIVAQNAKKTQDKSGMPNILCTDCENRVPLWDELEQCFASPEMQERVLELQAQSAIVLDNESKERALVGEVISTVALAGQICREFNVSDHGIDMEIEFKDDAGEATGQKVYLQLKSGDSYLRERKRDGAEVFTIKDPRHVRYWMAQSFAVMLVIRTSGGEIRCMEVRDWLKRASNEGQRKVKEIVFDGSRFDVMTVRHWRESALG